MKKLIIIGLIVLLLSSFSFARPVEPEERLSPSSECFNSCSSSDNDFCDSFGDTHTCVFVSSCNAYQWVVTSCSSGMKCVSGMCKYDDACFSHTDCSNGWCDFNSNPNECNSYIDIGFRCKQSESYKCLRYCKDRSWLKGDVCACHYASDCPSKKTCVSGECLSVSSCSPSDCDDGNLCTEELCVGSICINKQLTGTTCNGGFCKEGTCYFAPGSSCIDDCLTKNNFVGIEGTNVACFKTLFDGVSGVDFCQNEGTICYKYNNDCDDKTLKDTYCYSCSPPPDLVCESDEWLTPEGQCCPKGAFWDSDINICVSQNKCGLTPVDCFFRPPNDPSGLQSNFFNSKDCITNDAQACCYFPDKYGEENVYYYQDIIVY